MIDVLMMGQVFIAQMLVFLFKWYVKRVEKQDTESQHTSSEQADDIDQSGRQPESTPVGAETPAVAEAKKSVQDTSVEKGVTH